MFIGNLIKQILSFKPTALVILIINICGLLIFIKRFGEALTRILIAVNVQIPQVADMLPELHFAFRWIKDVLAELSESPQEARVAQLSAIEFCENPLHTFDKCIARYFQGNFSQQLAAQP